MSTFTDLEKDAASVNGFVNENGLIETRRNGPKPSYQYLVDGWNTQIDAELDRTAGVGRDNAWGTVQDGIDNTVDGDYFSVVSPDVNGYLDLYKNESGSAVYQKTYPSDKIPHENERLLDRTVGIYPDFVDIDYRVVNGQIQKNGSDTSFVLTRTTSYECLQWIDVENVESLLTTSSTNTASSGWPWVFRDVDYKWVGNVEALSGEIEVPTNAKWAARTLKDPSTTDSGFSLKAKYAAVTDTSERVKSTLKNIIAYEEEVSPIEFVKYDYTQVRGIPANGLNIKTGENFDGRESCEWIDVSSSSKISVTSIYSDNDYVNAPTSWQWFFRDKNWNLVAQILKFNGVIDVPEGAKWASRTIRFEDGYAYAPDTGFGVSLTKKVTVKEKTLNNEMKINKVSQSFLNNARLTVSPNHFIGGTQSERIHAASEFINNAGGGTLELGVDTLSDPQISTWLIDSALLLGDNCWLSLIDATLKLSDGTFDNIIRNRGVEVNPSEPNGIALNLVRNYNIKVFGNNKATCSIEGPAIPFQAVDPVYNDGIVPWVGDRYGWRSIGILMANVHDLEYYNFKMADTTCWAISNENGTENFHYHDIDFDTNVANGDGVDIRSGCSHGLVENITGNTKDDTVAMTTLNWTNEHPRDANGPNPNGRYLYPLQVGGFENGWGINDITVKNINTSTGEHMVRVLADGLLASNISISNIEDSSGVTTRLITLTNGSTTEDNMTNITINGVVNNGATNAIYIARLITNSRINFVRQVNSSTDIVDDQFVAAGSTLDLTNIEYV